MGMGTPTLKVEGSEWGWGLPRLRVGASGWRWGLPRTGVGASGWGWGRQDGDGGVGMGMGALLIESTVFWMGLETPEVEVGGGLDGDGGSPDPG